MPPHLPAGSVVVQVHERPGVPLLPLLGIHKGLAEAHGVLHVVTAATPVKRALGVPRRALLGGIAGAGVQLALAAGSRQRVNHTSRGDGVHEGHLAATWVVRMKCYMVKNMAIKYTERPNIKTQKFRMRRNNQHSHWYTSLHQSTPLMWDANQTSRFYLSLILDLEFPNTGWLTAQLNRDKRRDPSTAATCMTRVYCCLLEAFISCKSWNEKRFIYLQDG